MDSPELSQILESSTDCIKFLDLEARLLFMSGKGCKALEIDDFSQVANAYWPDFWKGSDADAARAAIETAKVGGIGHFQGYFPTWKGTPKWWDVVITPILGVHGKPERLLAISRDITEARQAEDRLRATLESIGDGFVACDAEWRLIYMNQPAERLLGMGREELLGRSFWEAFPLAVGTNPKSEYCRIAAGEPSDFENFYDPWGRWFRQRCYPRAGGGISVYFQDITERKQAEDNLREAVQQLRLITDNMAAGVVRCNLDHRYVWISPSYAASLGRAPAEIAGRRIPDVLGDEYYQTIRPYIESVLSGERVEYEAQVKSHEGVNLWIHAVYVPTQGLDRKIDGWIAVVRDITEGHNAEARLRASEARLKNAERLAHLGHWNWDIKANQVFWSDEMFRIFGQPQDFTPSYPGFLQLVESRDRGRVAGYSRDLAGQSGRSHEYQIIRPSGELRTVRSNLEVLLNEKGAPEHMFGACQDITDVRQAQEESFARQKLETVGTLASGIAHDFNNLLGGVLAQAELALTELPPGSRPEEELKAIRNAAIRGSEIVRQLMIYAGREREVLELVDVSEIVAEMIELLRVSVSKHARLDTDLGQDLPGIRANAAQLRQVVMNLVTNASEAMGDRDGVIRVTTGRVTASRATAVKNGLAEGDFLQLEVSDTGCGMSQETQARVFDPFFTTKSAGHGLGLAVVDGIVRGLQGTIRIASEAGRGSKFQVLLPFAETTADATSGAMSSTGESPHPSQEMTVLVVEDEEPLRQAVVKMLRKTGFEVLEAANGAAAIDQLRANERKIDVILLDMTIPGASSHEVVAEAAQARPDIRVILTSAYSQESLTPLLSASQIYGFIRKPFQLADLLQTLRSALYSSQAKNSKAG
jgi:two-component system cell cycle sensor histidine kinase/response regulator CckA